MLLSYTSNPLEIDLFLSTTFINFQQNLQTLSSITISSLNPTEFNWSLHNSTAQTLTLTLFPTQPIVVGPILNYSLNLSDFFLITNNLYMPSKSCTIQLADYYPMSDTAKATSASISSQVTTSQTVAQGAGYASTFLSSSSSLFVQGLMLVEMIFYLKYINIDYPPTVVEMFETKNSNPSFIFQMNFVDDPKDKGIIPQLFQHYNVSVYFLNNVGEALCQICAIILIATFVLLITPYHLDESNKPGIFLKVVIFIRDALVWETVLFYILMNLQKIIFFISCSWMFPPLNSFNALLNLSFATVIGFIIFLWLTEILIKIKVCQSFKESLKEANSPKIFENSKDEINPNSHSFQYGNSVYPVSNDAELASSKRPNPFNESEIYSPQPPAKTPLDAKTYKKNNLQLVIDEATSQDHTMLDLNAQPINESVKPLKKDKKVNFIRVGLSKIIKFLYNPKNKEVFLFRYEVLHLDYKSERTIHKYYAFIYYIRQSLLSIVVVYGCSNPLLVAIIINVINMSFLLFTVFSRPFTTYYSYIVSVVNEVITESALFSGLMIAIYDWQNDMEIEKRMTCGWIIIFANAVLLYWVIATGIAKPIFYAVHEYCQKKKNLRQIHSYQD